MENFGVWFDIPVKDMDRAIGFYGEVFKVTLQEVGAPNKRYAMFPFEAGVVSGGLVEDPEAVANKGVRLYLNGGDNLDIPLSRIEGSGGKIIQAKTAIGANGHMALFQDTEGNLIGLHSSK